MRLSFLSIGVMAACCAVSGARAQNVPTVTKAEGNSGAATSAAAASDDQAQSLKQMEKLVRDLYAWGPDYGVKLGPAAESSFPGFYKVPIVVSFKGQSDQGELYLSKDGKTVLRGDLFELGKDPYAGVRAHLHAEGNPAIGPENAPVTLVEFADFECPHCREFSDDFPAIQQKFPQVRLVYKDLPLSDIHPWAETAAIGARCAFVQSPAAFWKMHDAIFKNQDNITPGNAWEELNGFARDEGLDADAFKICMSSADARSAIDANRTDAATLGVSTTPTVYVNGRPVVGGDPGTVDQYIQYELDTHAKQ